MILAWLLLHPSLVNLTEWPPNILTSLTILPAGLYWLAQPVGCPIILTSRTQFSMTGWQPYQAGQPYWQTSKSSFTVLPSLVNQLNQHNASQDQLKPVTILGCYILSLFSRCTCILLCDHSLQPLPWAAIIAYNLPTFPLVLSEIRFWGSRCILWIGLQYSQEGLWSSLLNLKHL